MRTEGPQTKDEEQSPPRRDQRAPLSPGRAFVILLAALLVLGTAGYLFLDNDEPSEQPIARGPEQPSDDKPKPRGLTNKEAIAKFKELDDKLIEAYRTGDSSVLTSVFAEGSRGLRQASREIRTLNHDGVASRTDFHTLTLALSRNHPDIIQVREVVIVTPKFIDRKTGEDITNDPTPQRQVVKWSLIRDKSHWRIRNALVVAAQRLDV